MTDLDRRIFNRLVDRFGYHPHIAKDIVDRGPVFDKHLDDYLRAKHASLHEINRERAYVESSATIGCT